MLLTSPPPGFAPDRTFFVALKGGDVDNIADGLTKIAALTPAPSAAAPAALMIFPGVYSTAPFTVPAWVTILGAVTEHPVILETDTATAQFVTATANAALAQLTLRGASGVGGIGVGYLAGAAGEFELEHVIVDDCTDGVYVDGAGRVIDLDDVKCIDCDNSYRVGTGGGTLRGHGAMAENDAVAALHLLVEAVAGIVYLRDADMRDDKFSVIAGSDLAMTHQSDTPQEKSYRVLSELQVGSPEHPRETCLGEGDSHTRGMVVKTNTNAEAGTWATLTNLFLEDASSDTLFPGLTANNALYVGGDAPFSGIKALITTARAGGVIVAEFWNGSAWVGIAHMSTDANAPYAQYAQDVFSRVNSEQIRYAPITGWATKSLDSVTKYWMRYRITTAITTAPAADKIKLHTNRTEVNGDGLVEHFGASIVKRAIQGHYQLLVESGNKGGDVDVAIASTMVFKVKRNRYEDGQSRNNGLTFEFLEGIDTTRGIEVEAVWYPLSDEVASDVEMEVAHVLHRIGVDTMDGTKAEDGRVGSIDAVPANSSYLTVKSVINVPIADALVGDVLGLMLIRDATGGNLDDTYPDNIVVMSMRLSAWFWKGA